MNLKNEEIEKENKTIEIFFKNYFESNNKENFNDISFVLDKTKI